MKRPEEMENVERFKNVFYLFIYLYHLLLAGLSSREANKGPSSPKLYDLTRYQVAFSLWVVSESSVGSAHQSKSSFFQYQNGCSFVFSLEKLKNVSLRTKNTGRRTENFLFLVKRDLFNASSQERQIDALDLAMNWNPDRVISPLDESIHSLVFV